MLDALEQRSHGHADHFAHEGDRARRPLDQVQENDASPVAQGVVLVVHHGQGEARRNADGDIDHIAVILRHLQCGHGHGLGRRDVGDGPLGHVQADDDVVDDVLGRVVHVMHERACFFDDGNGPGRRRHEPGDGDENQLQPGEQELDQLERQQDRDQRCHDHVDEDDQIHAARVPDRGGQRDGVRRVLHALAPKHDLSDAGDVEQEAHQHDGDEDADHHDRTVLIAIQQRARVRATRIANRGVRRGAHGGLMLLSESLI
jgi:hypothetical protein